jgi:hypothetical protein
MTVLVGHDVGDREVADRPTVPLRAAGERLVERAVVDVGRELLRDVDRVVTRAVRGGAVTQRAVRVPAGAGSGLAGRDPLVADPGLRQAGVLERLGPVGIDVLGDRAQQLLHVLGLGAVLRAEDEVVAAGGGRRSGQAAGPLLRLLGGFADLPLGWLVLLVGRASGDGVAVGVVCLRGGEVQRSAAKHEQQRGHGQQRGANQ